MKVVQVLFVRKVPGKPPKALSKVAWVDVTWKLKEGSIVSFEDEKEKWTVVKIYKTIQDVCDVIKKWGLNLPKSQRTER